MQFKILKKDKHSKARTGIFRTAHGEIKTPFFMPIATKGSIKGVSPDERSWNPDHFSKYLIKEDKAEKESLRAK